MPSSLDQKLAFAENRAREHAAEVHFFDEAQPFFPLGFSVGYRGDGCHWDIYAEQCPGKASAFRAAYPEGQTTAVDGGRERAFCIRGIPGSIVVRDERWDPNRPHPRAAQTFKSVSIAMMWIMEELMQVPPEQA